MSLNKFKILSYLRELSIYNIEEKQMSPERFFTKREMEIVIAYAEEVLSLC